MFDRLSGSGLNEYGNYVSALSFDLPVKTEIRSCSSNISNTKDSVSSEYPNTEKKVENTRRSGVILTKFKVFG